MFLFRCVAFASLAVSSFSFDSSSPSGGCNSINPPDRLTAMKRVFLLLVPAVVVEGVYPAMSSRRALWSGFATAALPEDEVSRALSLFTQGKYDESLEAWVELTMAAPRERLYWSNRGTVELVVGSSRGDAALLRGAVESFDRAAALGDEDPVSLNNRGNALAALDRWEEAAAAYDAAAAAAARSKVSTSVASENRAQVAVELGDLADAERRTLAILRRDPNFLDARALLAAIRFKRGDLAGAEDSYAQICRPTVSAPNRFRPPTPGIGGTDWCEIYSDTAVVRGRWTPASLAAYDAFLRSRPPAARIVANANPFKDT
ncbi:hypothetical protein CTAYLR_005633 [Chrysophaeum taylorii]|uniref:Tetratricopeptide repeat protein n=1 Tax=Chrysophaeum taylorii TaxID=2483200 RepID=A0AAD7UPH2_9STRA|nr:hypothetical protein CTAYLR_005633 [Chrysophaeum taylorii]